MASAAPGLSYVAVPQPDDPSPLRTDVAGFFGPTRRGPAGELVRVVGWRGYRAQFGDVFENAYTPYSIRGYFQNGGQVAHVYRVCAPGVQLATGILRVGSFDKQTSTWQKFSISSQGFGTEQYRVEATSAGAWAEGGSVKVRFRQKGLRGGPEVDVAVRVAGEPAEYFAGVAPALLADTIAAGSNLIRLIAIGPVPASFDPTHPGPVERQLQEVTLRGGSDGDAPSAGGDRAAYQQANLAAVQALNDEEEVALIASPDLGDDPWLDAVGRDQIIQQLLQQAAALHDRLVLLDAPPSSPGAPQLDVPALLTLAQHYRDLGADPRVHRAGAFYHPWLQIPLDGAVVSRDPFLALPPSGHVAGVISRLDRERGAHHTPANAPLYEAVDVVTRLEDDEQGLLHPAGVNLVRCLGGYGLQVWGSRTLDRGDGAGHNDLGNGRFLAHRRLVHRLVRAGRRVAEPLVFDVNGPELWLALVRAMTSVLLQAFRAGALQGDTPDQGFYVKCDEQTNPPELIDLGQCVCEVGVAPAKPMEFIVLKVTLLANGTLEVVE